jgi:pimeloyl-ACP methyl ester carboxylesterase
MFLQYLWQTFTGDKTAAPFPTWTPYVSAMARSGIARSSALYHRSAYATAEQTRALAVKKLEIPVLAIAGQNGLGAHHRSLVEAFADRLHDDIVLNGAGHFVPEERPSELLAAMTPFLSL